MRPSPVSTALHAAALYFSVFVPLELAIVLMIAAILVVFLVLLRTDTYARRWRARARSGAAYARAHGPVLTLALPATAFAIFANERMARVFGAMALLETVLLIAVLASLRSRYARRTGDPWLATPEDTRARALCVGLYVAAVSSLVAALFKAS